MNFHLMGHRSYVVFCTNVYWMWSSLLCDLLGFWVLSYNYISWSNDSDIFHRDWKHKLSNVQNDCIGNSGNLCFCLLQAGALLSLSFSIRLLAYWKANESISRLGVGQSRSGSCLWFLKKFLNINFFICNTRGINSYVSTWTKWDNVYEQFNEYLAWENTPEITIECEIIQLWPK